MADANAKSRNHRVNFSLQDQLGEVSRGSKKAELNLVIVFDETLIKTRRRVLKAAPIEALPCHGERSKNMIYILRKKIIVTFNIASAHLTLFVGFGMIYGYREYPS